MTSRSQSWESKPGSLALELGLVHMLCPDLPTTWPWANLFPFLSLSGPLSEIGTTAPVGVVLSSE